ncbi:M20 aminoacylase family protein [Shinella sp.]|uniref:M20 aminoacylase family protein n=1 Tax=Shinella sp. TaxID=1870904 RepID=UPI00289CB24A|nr:M20 aminoacylase family protein [Shinella sp.]
MSSIDRSKLDAYMPDLIALRHDIHAHPETAFEEVRTSALVAEKLREWGIEVHEGIGRTGVVGVLKGSRPGQRRIGLRADIDALHIFERNEFDYASTVEGKMHACGHDGHTTMLLGAARYLAQDPDFAGTVHFIFQPAEESAGGAPAMMKDGLFDRFPCDAVYGLHTEPGRPVGEIASRIGPALAGSMSFHVTFKGTAGHGGAAPHLADDCTIPVAHFILGLQSIVGRKVAAIDAAVISIGHISGGSKGSPNVMPAEMLVSGTARYFRDDVQQIIVSGLRNQAELFAKASNCSVDVQINEGTPPLVNHPEAFESALAAAERTFGKDKVERERTLSTGGEDFAYFANTVPGTYMWMGGGVGPDGLVHDVHTDRFDFNDASIPYGVSYWVNLVHTELRSDETATSDGKVA